ncbi:MAG: hypothetical protein ABI615_01205, partial [Chthoniobacterales bacterium]
MPGCYVAFHKQLGDLVLLEPALSRLRDYHGAPVRLLTRGSFRPILELMTGIQFVMSPSLVPATTAYCYDPVNKSTLRSVLTPTLRRRAVLPEESELKPWHRWAFNDISGLRLGS